MGIFLQDGLTQQSERYLIYKLGKIYLLKKFILLKAIVFNTLVMEAMELEDTSPHPIGTATTQLLEDKVHYVVMLILQMELSMRQNMPLLFSYIAIWT